MTPIRLIFEDRGIKAQGFKTGSLQHRPCFLHLFRISAVVHNTTTMAYHFEGLVAVYCRPIESKDCSLRPCVQVCCSPWTIFDPNQNECVDIGENPILRWKPILHDKATGQLLNDLELLKRSVRVNNCWQFRQFSNFCTKCE